MRPDPVTASGIQALTDAMLAQACATDNALVSGVSAWLALSVMGAGSAGATATDFEHLLGVPAAELVARRREVKDILEAVAGLGRATALWSKIPLREQFSSAFPDVGFHSTLDQAVLDEWFRQATNGLLDTFPAQISENTLLALVDTLSLKAQWATPFPAIATHPGVFTTRMGSTVTVTMMRNDFPICTYGESDAVTVWESTTAVGYTPVCRVLFGLGKPGMELPEVLAASQQCELRPGPTQEQVRVTLPRFAFNSSNELVEVLRRNAAGVLSEHADFSPMASSPLRIDSAKQDALIRVNEEGFEAAAATAVMTRAGSFLQPPAASVTFDRPFAFTILDYRTNLPLLTGWVADPSPGEATTG